MKHTPPPPPASRPTPSNNPGGNIHNNPSMTHSTSGGAPPAAPHSRPTPVNRPPPGAKSPPAGARPTGTPPSTNMNQTSSGSINGSQPPNMAASTSGGASSAYAPSPSANNNTASGQQQQNKSAVYVPSTGNINENASAVSPNRTGSSSNNAASGSQNNTAAPRLVGSAAVPPSHAPVPQVKRRPSPVRPGNSPTNASGSFAQPPSANNNNATSGSFAQPPQQTNQSYVNNTNNMMNAQQQQQKQRPNSPPKQQQQNLGGTTSNLNSSGVVNPPPRRNTLSPSKQPNYANPPNNMMGAGGVPPAPRTASGGPNNNNRGGPSSNVSPPRNQPNYYNNNSGASQSAVSPIPIQSALVSSPERSAAGRYNNNNNNTAENNNNNNVTWAEQENSRTESLRRYERDMSAARASVSGVNARRLAPPENDAMHTSVITENVDTVGLHRTDIQDAINSSHYAVSGSQFPLSVVPQSKSKTRAMTSTVEGCISIEVLVMINGAHGSGISSKCDEVRIVNVDPARTTIRRLLNLAHKAVNFVPVTRGVLQMSARTLSTRRIGKDVADKPTITPIPLPNDVSSITEMVTLAEDDLCECIPLRENDVVNWVEADPVVTPVYSASSPNFDRSMQQPQDMRLVGSPNREILASSRLPRATHENEYNNTMGYMSSSNNNYTNNNNNNSRAVGGGDHRNIDVPVARDHLDFEKMSPRRDLRQEPGNGNASIAHRQISGRIGGGNNYDNNNNSSTTPNNTNNNGRSSGVTTPSWKNDHRAVEDTNRRIESLNTTPRQLGASSSASASAVPHSSIAQYANSSLRGGSNNNNTDRSSPYKSSINNSNNNRAASTTSNNNAAVPISLSSGETIIPRSEEERRLVEEIRAIRRDIGK